MIRIAGGDWRGRKFHVPKSSKVRPSASIVRTSIFNILESIQLKRGLGHGFGGMRVLDLFAGSGALGWEALSRGADYSVFLEKDKEHARTIARNAEEFDCADRVKILNLAYEKSKTTLLAEAPFQLIFADPPYDFAGLASISGLVSELSELDSIFVMEHAPGTEVSTPAEFQLHSQRELGPALISVFTRSGNPDMLGE
jgi:16S rRNA (guanine966-N2)-methyltransferase